MKVFWLKTPEDEREIPMFRGIDKLNDISIINIKEELPFNYLVITNSEDSNCVCTLRSLQFRTEDSNIAQLLMSDEKISCSKIKQADIFNIGYEFKRDFKEEHTELATVINNTNLLNSNYIILLPKGSLIIKLENGVSEVQLSIHYSVDFF